MAEFYQVFNDVLKDASGIAQTADKFFQEEAELSTQTKAIQLQTDINTMLSEIRQSGDDENWNAKVNARFEEIKSGMSNKSSPYYCRNNLQAKQFNAILEQNRLGVSAKVGQMAEQRQMEKDVVIVQKSKEQLGNLYFGQDYIDRANELDRKLYETGRLSPAQYQQQKDLNFRKGYTEARIKTFDASLDDAIAQGKSFEAFFEDIQKSIPEMKHSDINGLDIDFDKATLDEQIKKACSQSYNAKLRDIQDNNANQLSQIYQSLLQQTTMENRLAIARRGQMAMNNMLGLKLSENDRIKYAKFFDIFTETKNGSGSGSGGSSGANLDKFEDFIKAAPEDAVQLVKNGQLVNYNDGKRLLAKTLNESWLYGDYKENQGKSLEEREATWGEKYMGKTSEEVIGNQMYDLLIKERPALKLVFDTQIKPVIDDVKKHPENYDDNTVIQLSNLWVDTVLGSNADETDEELAERFTKSKNDIILSKTKYLEFNKKGQLLKKFNAKSESDIAKAARLVSDSDFVFTFNGNTLGKNKELEAEGGIVSVLKNAVAGTLGIPESEKGSVGFFYKPDALHDDVTSTPIITYKNKAYEVIANDGDKGFSLRDYHTGEIIEGSLKGGKLERTENKKAAGNTVKELSEVRKQIEASREVDDAQWADLLYDKGMPKAAVAAGVTNAEDWNQSDKYTRITMLTSAARKVTKDAHKVEANKMSEDDFKKKYGFDYSTWNKASTRDKQFYTLLNN